jgi:hypothetical protein
VAGLSVGRYVLGVSTKITENPGQCVTPRDRLRAGAAHVHEDLPVRKAWRDLVADVHGQRGLTGPARPADRRDRDGTGQAPVLFAGEPSGELVSLLRPAGEVSEVGGQLGRWRPAPGVVGRIRVSRRELQGVGQPAQRVFVCPAGTAGLQIADRPDADPGLLGQFLLAVPGRQPITAQAIAEPAGPIFEPVHYSLTREEADMTAR